MQKFAIEAAQEENISKWYKDTITKGELLEYHDINGCYVLRPNGYFVWNTIKEYFTKRIAELNVQEAYFPMLVTKSALEKEKDHLENFAPEVAWITMCGDKALEHPVAIRPTSEAIIYPYFAKWIQSYRDLPLKINQWCNVLRWETTQTMPFVRGREFLWQEGHTAHLDRADADKEVHQILEMYADVYEQLLAVPVVRGRKSKRETFAGADYTTTVEAFVPRTGRGIQAATSHSLGINFAKMFEVSVEDPKATGERLFVHQNSWGLSTRSLGVCILTHADERGLVFPPKVAPVQAVIVTCGITKNTSEEEKEGIISAAQGIQEVLQKAGVRVKADLSTNTTPGHKFNYWEVRGVPLRIELGPKDLKKNEVSLVWRSEKTRKNVGIESVEESIKSELDLIQKSMYYKAKVQRDAAMTAPETVEEFTAAVHGKKMAHIQWCGREECEESIKARTTKKDKDGTTTAGAKSLCIPFSAPISINTEKTCFACSEAPTCIGLFGRSY
ncbi:bifunctional glutamyl/prolyl-tRNA synthetase [Nematocida sp. AWRm77]|nr:bifunctional glutamyl/prolyl-tRNA synthetase [Nematocida sp. AWRm77]